MNEEGVTEAEYEQMKIDQANLRATIAKHGMETIVQAVKDERDFPRKSGKVK